MLLHRSRVPESLKHGDRFRFLTSEEVPMPMRRLATALLAATLLVSPLAARAAGPGVRAELLNGVPRIVLEGSYSGSRYTVGRSAVAGQAGAIIGERDALCTGDCYVLDRDALLGATYFYRFDVTGPDGLLRTYGPFEVIIGGRAANGLSASLSPNPLRDRGTVRVTAALAAGARVSDSASAMGLPGEVTLVDMSGRTLRTLWSGTLDRLTFDVPFTARDSRGNRLAAGLYFIVLRAGEHRTISRVAVVR